MCEPPPLFFKNLVGAPANFSAMYHPLIMQHSREPIGYHKRPEAERTLLAYNPLCGDKFSLFLDFQGDAIAGATFHGYGCAISKASASVLVEQVRGKSLAEARQLVADFLAFLDAPSAAEIAPPTVVVAAFAEARHFPGRMDCATLAWRALAAELARAG